MIEALWLEFWGPTFGWSIAFGLSVATSARALWGAVRAVDKYLKEER